MKQNHFLVSSLSALMCFHLLVDSALSHGGEPKPATQRFVRSTDQLDDLETAKRQFLKLGDKNKNGIIDASENREFVRFLSDQRRKKSEIERNGRKDGPKPAGRVENKALLERYDSNRNGRLELEEIHPQIKRDKTNATATNDGPKSFQH